MNRASIRLESLARFVGFRSAPSRFQFFLCFSFIGVPLILLFLGSWQIAYEEIREKWKDLDWRMEKTMNEFSSSADPLIYLEDMLKEWASGKNEGGVQGEERSGRLFYGNFKRRFPGLFSFTVFNKIGKPFPEFNDQELDEKAGELLVSTYNQDGDGRELSERDNIELGKIFGPLANYKKSSSFKFYRANFAREKRYFLIVRDFNREREVILCHLNEPPDLALRVVKEKVMTLSQYLLKNSRETQRAQSARAQGMRDAKYGRKILRPSCIPKGGDVQQGACPPLLKSSLSQKMAGIKIGLVPINSIDNSIRKQFGSSGEDLDTVCGIFETTISHKTIFNDELWRARSVDSEQKVLMVGTPDTKKLISRLNLSGIACVVAFLLVSAFCLRLAQSEKPLFMSVRWKVALLLLFSSGIPVLTASFTKYIVHQKQRKSLENEVYRKNENALNLFGMDFIRSVGNLEKEVIEFLKLPPPSAANFLTSAAKAISHLEGISEPMSLDLIDNRGKRHISNSSAGSSKHKEQTSKVLSRLGGVIISYFNPKGGNLKEREKAEMYSMMAEISGIPLSAFIAELVQNLGKMHRFLGGDADIYFFVKPFFDNSNQARYLFFGTWDQEDLEKNWQKTANIKLPFPKSRIIFNTRGDNKYLYGTELHEPNRRFSNQTQPLHQQLEWKNKQYLLTAVHPKHLTYFDLYILTETNVISSIQHASLLKNLREIFLVFLITLSIGGYLSTTFLQQIKNLNRGILALENRDFHSKIPVISKDEFGILSRAFNEMSESLADLEVAKAIQEGLFPAGELSFKDWKVFGSSRSAVQVGGDFFDYFVFDERYLVTVIGDVVGHGVGAALIMGIAKGLLRAFSDKILQPELLLKEMSGVIWKIFKGRKYLTFFILVIDSRENRVFGCSAGHVLPMLIRENQVTEISAQGLPLGLMARSPQKMAKLAYKTVEFEMLPADTILLFTDGFTEASTGKKDFVGYSRVIENLPGQIRPGPEETVRAIQTWHDSIVYSERQEDDITLVVLQKDGLQS